MTSEEPKRDRHDPPSRTQVLNKQRRFKIYRSSVSSFCREILSALEKEHWSLSVVFVGVERMKAMNARYRRRNQPTDVLSFSYGGETIEDVPYYLGEVVIAPAVAWDQARRFDVPPDRELRMLLVHGILHLLGYDHETDHGEMLRLQARLMRRFGSRSTALAETRDTA